MDVSLIAFVLNPNGPHGQIARESDRPTGIGASKARHFRGLVSSKKTVTSACPARTWVRSGSSAAPHTVASAVRTEWYAGMSTRWEALGPGPGQTQATGAKTAKLRTTVFRAGLLRNV